MVDVIIIGAGVIGCAIARELSRYERTIIVLEKALDVCEGTSKANSGIVHAGFDATPGSLKAKFNVLGNQKMEQLARDLDFLFERNGSLVVSYSKEETKTLFKLKAQGEANGVKELYLLSGDEARAREPNLSKDVVAALYAPTGGIVCPFGLTLALAENAAANGVSFSFGTKVIGIEKIDDHFLIHTNKKEYVSRIVIDAAGVYAGTLFSMVSKEKMHITPRKGEYCLFDSSVKDFVKHTIFQVPTKFGKGVLVTRTVHGNLLLGPTATDITDQEATNTTAQGLQKVLTQAEKSVANIPKDKIITSFAGLRAHEAGGDFIIRQASDCSNFFVAGGMESPGLSCAPAVGEYMADLLQKVSFAKEKEHFISVRKGIPFMAAMSLEEQRALIALDARFANVICRCERITEGEIVAAINRPLGAVTLDGVKRRTRAGMGRCQGGFCAPKVVAILARELQKTPEEILKSDFGSAMLIDRRIGE